MKRVSQFFIASMMIVMSTLFLCSCGEIDEDSDTDNLSGDTSVLLGEWLCEDDFFPIDKLTFVSGKKGVYVFGSSTNPKKLEFTYSFDGNTIYFKGIDGITDNDEGLYTIRKGKESIYFAGSYYFKANSNDTPSGGVNNGGNDDKTPNETTIKNAVKAKVSYSGYYTHISLSHTLYNLYPGQKISYEIGHSDRYSGECLVITNNRSPIYPSEYVMNGVTEMTVDYPFYYYFLYKAMSTSLSYEADEYKEMAGNCEMYLSSYKALKEKSSLTQDEKSLLQDLEKELNKYQAKVKYNYTVWVYVLVGNTRVLITSYNI